MENLDSTWVDDNSIVQELKEAIPQETISQEAIPHETIPQETVNVQIQTKIIDVPLNNQEILQKAKELPLAWFDNWKDLMEYIQYDLKADIDKQIWAIKSFIANNKNPEQLEIAKKQLSQLIALKDKNTVSTTSEKKIVASSLQVFKDQIKSSGWIWKWVYRTNINLIERKLPDINWKNIDIEWISLDLLSWVEKRTGKPEMDRIGDVTRTKFKSIKLDDVFEIYKNFNNWSDKESILEEMINSLLRNEVMWELKRLFISMRKKDPNLKASRFLRKIRSIIRESLYKAVTQINSYIDETAKWKEAFNKYKKTKASEDVWYLIKDSSNIHFQEYIKQKKWQHNWTVKETTRKQRNYAFSEDIWTKLNEISTEQSLSNPIKFWTWVYEWEIVYKKYQWDSWQEWLYIMWDRFIFDWIKDVSDIIVDWDNVMIKWIRFWQAIDLKFTKEEFIDSLQNLIMYWNTDFEPIWDKKKVYLRKARFV